jgi:hypothetical protein
VVLLALAWAAVLWRFRRELIACWAEPTLRRPVVILESDDWGPGPARHAEALTRIAALLERYRDPEGRHPVMTLGVILACPDGARLRATPDLGYARLALDDPRSQPVLRAMQAGIQAGVFAPQLHGLEHFWPPALLAVAQADASLRAWLSASEFPASEDLPSHLQSRWTDARELPSRELPASVVVQALAEECAVYARVFGARPAVLVPPTFVWTQTLEWAAAAQGIPVLMTPGRRLVRRAADGRPEADDRLVYAGRRIGPGTVYAVRDVYFEPGRGHTAADALDAIERRAILGRPALLETHRANFLAEEEAVEGALIELDRLLEAVLRRFPRVAFRSSAELGAAYLGQGSALVERRVGVRLRTWVRRLAAIRRLRQLGWLTGLALLVLPLLLVPGPAAGRRDGPEPLQA